LVLRDELTAVVEVAAAFAAFFCFWRVLRSCLFRATSFRHVASVLVLNSVAAAAY